jgi:hypothetical protein
MTATSPTRWCSGKSPIELERLISEQRSYETNEENLWRAETPGPEGWQRTARRDDPDKYLMISADTHANKPFDLWATRIDKKYRDRLPRVVTDKNGKQWRYSEGHRKARLMEFRMLGEDGARGKAGAALEDRLADNGYDGIDAEIMFPNKGLAMWATPRSALAPTTSPGLRAIPAWRGSRAGSAGKATTTASASSASIPARSKPSVS